MIEAVEIRDPEDCPVEWWHTVPWLKGKKRIEFGPGINIVFGPNGSGKSTLVKLIARMLCCEQGGVQAITQDAIEALVERKADRSGRLRDGVLPIHDGSPILHFDPGNAIGLVGGMAAFDHDFSLEGIRNAVFKGSSGQTTIRRLESVLRPMVDGKWSEIDHKVPVERTPSVLLEFLHGSKERIRPTILLDEPTRSVDLAKEIGFWLNMPKLVAKNGFQLIAAAHTPLVLDLPATLIETEPGYVDDCRRRLEHFRKSMAVFKEADDIIASKKTS